LAIYTADLQVLSNKPCLAAKAWQGFLIFSDIFCFLSVLFAGK